MAGQDDERARLEASVRDITQHLEDEALAAIVEPLRSLELTIQQLKVLTVLVTTEPGTTLTALAAAFEVSAASMSGILDRLVTQGVAVRSSDAGDLRVRRVRATPFGRAAVRRLVARRPEYNARIVGRLRLDDLRALEQGMRAVQRGLREAASERD